jgi:hypothetical protein
VGAALPELPRAWLSIELPGFRPHAGTYSVFDYAQLPPIDRELDPDLEWLMSEAVLSGSLAEIDPERHEGSLTNGRLESLLVLRKVPLPPAFGAFLAMPDARSRVRSCTDCYVDLADHAVPVAGGGLLVHFLVDSQWLLHWLVFVGPAGEKAVVVTTSPFGYAGLSEGAGVFDPPRAAIPPVDGWLEDGSAAVCADSFSEFLYRFWIENEIWFALAQDERPLTTEEAAYAGHYSRAHDSR